MRKIITILLIMAISSFSFVYAQENYSINNNNEESFENHIEASGKLEQNIMEKEEENKTIEQDEKANATEMNEVQKEDKLVDQTKGNNSNGTELNKKSVQANKEKTINVKTEKKKESSSTKPNNSTKENTAVQVKEESKKVDGSPKIDTSNANSGSFKAKYLSDIKLKVMVVKGSDRYTYDLKGDNSYQSFPLQLGDGLYKISIMENIGGNEYKYVLTKEVEVKSSNPNAKYLTSVQMINWNNSMAAIKKAKSLTKGLSDQKKIDKIYNYIVNNIRYDSSITKLPSGYIPNINTTYSSKKGICYDFASLFAAMLRSVGVPTKLIKGESSNVEGYHAWNEVYINGKWRIVDTSYDSQLKAGGYSISKYKSSKEYFKSKQY